MTVGQAEFERVFDDAIVEHARVLAETKATTRDAFARLVTICVDCLRAEGKIIFFGNGGSAADAQHLAAELVGRFQHDRRAFPALSLTTDTSALTAIGNDFGFERIFARQIEALCRPTDVSIGLSTSGRSENILLGLKAARAMGARTAGLTGGNGGQMVGLADPLVIIPSNSTARIQEMHITLGHALCAAIEHGMNLR